MNAQPIRFSGLTSGMDTASMVQQLMRAESMRMNRLTSRRQVLQWRQEDLRGTMASLGAFRREHTDSSLSRGAINNSANWNTVNASVSVAGSNGSSNTPGISVSATHTARTGSFDIRVEQAATNDIARGQTFRITEGGLLTLREGDGVAPIAPTPGGQGLDLNRHTIHELLVIRTDANAPSVGADDYIMIRIGDAEVRVNASDSIQQFMDRINATQHTGATIRFDQMRGTFVMEGRGTGVSATIRTGNDDWGLMEHLGLADIRSSIQPPYLPNPAVVGSNPSYIPNPNFNPDILPYIPNPDPDFDPTIPRYILNQYRVDDPDDTTLPWYIENPAFREPYIANPEFANNPGYIPNPDHVPWYIPNPNYIPYGEAGRDLPINAVTDSRLVSTAQNAIIYYDVGGAMGAVRMEQESNRFEIHGLNIDLTSSVETGTVFTINAERNVDDVMENIRNFIEAYNNLLRQINSLHSTPRPRAGNSTRGAFFEPLTDEQREAMSDREIERWEEQARTGLLHRDRDLRHLQQQMRNAMFQPVRMNDGTTFSLHQIGITSIGMGGSGEDRLIGVLEIDEDRLRAALEEDSDRVRQLFARSHVEANNNTDNLDIRVSGTNFGLAAQNLPHIGVGFRLNELMQTMADSLDSPLRRRAGGDGVALDTTENMMSRQIRDYNRRIDQMQQFLIRRENHFFSMFARMENAMAQSHAQMDSLFAFMTQ